MGSDVYGLPSQETYLDSQNFHLDAAKIRTIIVISKFFFPFLCHFKNIVYLCRVFIPKSRLWARLVMDGDTTWWKSVTRCFVDWLSIWNTVYILPNPHDFRTADYILVRRNVYKLFDLKNISGKSIVANRLIESIGQANRVLLNLTIDYNPSSLARSIKMYFENSDEALEVMIFKGKKVLSVTRDLTPSSDYYLEKLVRHFGWRIDEVRRIPDFKDIRIVWAAHCLYLVSFLSGIRQVVVL